MILFKISLFSFSLLHVVYFSNHVLFDDVAQSIVRPNLILGTYVFDFALRFDNFILKLFFIEK